MTGTGISEIIHKWTGWCPNARVRMQNAGVPPEDEATVPSAGGSFTGRAIHWISLFRNQALCQTIAAFCIGLYMFAGLGGWSNLNLFIFGMVAGLPYSAITGIWYFRIFNEVLHDGTVVLWNRYDRTSGTLTIVALVVSISVWSLVLLGAIPGVSFAMTCAFFGGTVAVLFWGVLIAVRYWESGTHCQLHYNGEVLGLEKEDTHAIL
jgi:hypothetical protein